MVDGIDGGYQITCSGGAEKSQIWFNDASRHFNPANCTIYGIITELSGNATNVFWGLVDAIDPSTGADSVGAYNANGLLNIQSADGTTRSQQSTGISYSEGAKNQFKIVCTSANLKIYTIASDVWVLRVTKTSNRPSDACQPTFWVNNGGGTSGTGSISYGKIENDT